MNDTIQSLYDEFFAIRARLVEALRAEPKPVDPSWTFDTAAGQRTLADLFGNQNDLILIHNMGRSCSYCTLWADGIHGYLTHLQSRTAVVLVNADPLPVQQEFAASRGWTIPMASDSSGACTDGLGFATMKDGKRYLQPGFSTFHRSSDGTIEHIASDLFGPGDLYMPVFPMIELLRDGQGGWEPQYSYPKPIGIDL
jgi:predicted dithiol-disulfide oxidoreductase (DUF899 family)